MPEGEGAWQHPTDCNNAKNMGRFNKGSKVCTDNLTAAKKRCSSVYDDIKAAVQARVQEAPVMLELYKT